ncbi:melanoma-associated antigen 10-like [Grammomys surdaster]|uniref:melanoma-associated antigen 10-like n=1 Tax=Grammomys surdaster TaxID=491861 RepID=UPI0010A06552|nr:melanoma-associated antigen 10-like [Grammomys surdaster]
MEPTENGQNFNLCDILTQAQVEERGPRDDQGPIAEAGEVEAIAAISGDESAGGAPSSPQRAQTASTPPTDMGSTAEASSGNPLEGMPDTEFISEGGLNEKIIDLVRFLLVKFRRMELTNKEEMMQKVLRDYEEHYSVIFSKAAECMKLIFGIDMLEVDPFIHSYFLYPALGITYDGLLHGVIGVPKTGLVIIVLCIIFIENNCVSEEVFWYAMNNLGMYAGVDHYIFGDPRSLITEDFVEEGYVEYRQVPNSQPPRFEFLWGPRAYAETTKMKILEFYANMVRQDPTSYPERYAEALREEQERA